MPQYFLDTNVLLRMADRASAQHAAAVATISVVAGRGDELFLAPQVLMEFWSVVTRPLEGNGFAWTAEQARAKVTELLGEFSLLPETPAVFEEWLRLVALRGVTGKKVHDVRLVALMNVHQLKHLITFNTRDFDGYGIDAASPDEIAGN
ncbi:MAG: type II toxin-antitoxin system VapC family toxin [Thermoguttaceae bacterium]